MIIIDVNKERGIESALKVYKSRVVKSKQLQMLKDRQTYVKPSVVKREKHLKAVYSQRFKNGLD
jgi:small subunit ribosomal protein S21